MTQITGKKISDYEIDLIKVFIDFLKNYYSLSANYDIKINILKSSKSKSFGNISNLSHDINVEYSHYLLKSILHEFIHLKQFYKNELSADGEYIFYKGKKVISFDDYNKIDYNSHSNLEFEKEAHSIEAYKDFLKSKELKNLADNNPTIKYLVDNKLLEKNNLYKVTLKNDIHITEKNITLKKNSIIYIEARFTKDNMDKATELIINQLEKRLGVKFTRLTGDTFRKKRNQDNYVLKYRIEDDLSDTYKRNISFLWSERGEGFLTKIEFHSWVKKADEYRNPEVIDVTNLGITKVIDIISEKLKYKILNTYNIKDKKSEYEILLNLLKDKGGTASEYFYSLGKNKIPILKTHARMILSLDYRIALIRKLLGLSYNPKHTNEYLWGDKLAQTFDTGMSQDEIEKLSKDYHPEYDDVWK